MGGTAHAYRVDPQGLGFLVDLPAELHGDSNAEVREAPLDDPLVPATVTPKPPATTDSPTPGGVRAGAPAGAMSSTASGAD